MYLTLLTVITEIETAETDISTLSWLLLLLHIATRSSRLDTTRDRQIGSHLRHYVVTLKRHIVRWVQGSILVASREWRISRFWGWEDWTSATFMTATFTCSYTYSRHRHAAAIYRQHARHLSGWPTTPDRPCWSPYLGGEAGTQRRLCTEGCRP